MTFMTTCLKVFLSFTFLMFLASTAQSQRCLGIATSDWIAINSLYLNPASIADCREKISIGIFSLNVSVDNNLGPIPKIPDIGNTISNSDNIFMKSQKKNFSMMAPAAAFRGPGIMVTLSRKISLALTSGIRAINQFNNFDPALYKIFSSMNATVSPTPAFFITVSVLTLAAGNKWSYSTPLLMFLCFLASIAFVFKRDVLFVFVGYL